MTLEQKSDFLVAHDILLGDLWNIMDTFGFDNVVQAIEHCFARLMSDQSIWSK